MNHNTNTVTNQQTIVKVILDAVEKENITFYTMDTTGCNLAPVVFSLFNLYGTLDSQSSMFRLKRIEMCEKFKGNKVASIPGILDAFLTNHMFKNKRRDFESVYPIISKMIALALVSSISNPISLENHISEM